MDALYSQTLSRNSNARRMRRSMAGIIGFSSEQSLGFTCIVLLIRCCFTVVNMAAIPARDGKILSFRMEL